MAKYKAGFRFCPTDEELVDYLYLKNKVAAEETTEPLKDARKSNDPVGKDKRKYYKRNEKMATGVKEVSPMRLPDCIEYNKEGKECLLPPVEADPLKLCFHEYDLYGKTEPWEIWDKFEGDTLLKHGYDLLIFTQLKKKGNPPRVVRRLDTGGTWLQKIPPEEIVDSTTGELIAKKRTMSFKYGKLPHNTVSSLCWFLDEYSLLESEKGKYVLCRLRKKHTTSKKDNPPTTSPATSAGSNQPSASIEEAQSLVATEEKEQHSATAKEAKFEAKSSQAGQRRVKKRRKTRK